MEIFRISENALELYHGHKIKEMADSILLRSSVEKLHLFNTTKHLICTWVHHIGNSDCYMPTEHELVSIMFLNILT